MSTGDSRGSRVQRSRLARLLLAIVVVVPLAFAALYMWVMWDPTKTVKHMPVAIVNADQPIGDGDEKVQAGADVAANLVKSGALDFEIVDPATAGEGLRNGDYYFTIDIPADFSKTLSEIGDATVAPALITVTYNDNNTLKASSIGAAAMSQISASVLEGVSSTTVGTVLDGVDALGGGLRTAADGSGTLADGTGQLRSGADELADSVATQLAPGISSAARGSEQVDDGAGQLADGTVALQAGTDTLGAGATKLADGIESLVGSVDVAALTTALNQAQKAAPGMDFSTITAVLDGLEQLRSGSRQIATELTDPSARYRSGVDQLVTGSQKLHAGTGTLTDGLRQLEDGAVSLTDGTDRLRDGIHQVDDGANQLHDGLATGAASAPELSDDATRESLASLLSTPVTSTSTNLAVAQNNGPGGAPTMLIFASGLVVIAVFLSFRAHRYLTDDDAPPTIATVLRRAAAVGAVSLAAMAVVGGVLWLTLSPSPSPASLGQVILIAAAATLMNVTLTSILFTVFGYVGGAVTSLAGLMLQIFAYGGIWMVETLPAVFRILHPISPLTYVRDGMIAAFNGTPGFGSAFLTLIGIGAAAAVVNLLAVAAARRLYESGLAAEEAAPDESVPEPA
ncbi:YhgE/Pip domain-containing protein [Gordonia sp. VNK21]|uniref:YhgE/Pip domain-containing protein n=1 Tax=Gordonia sp. VNK21 TaxID=3382483 RepID=UPI0038D4C315